MPEPTPAVAADRAPVVLVAMGILVHLRAGGGRAAELQTELARAWSAAAAPHRQDDEPALVLHVVLDDDPAVVSRARADGAVAATELVPVLDEVSTRVTQRCLEQRVGSHWLLHACALADPSTGATIVLVAPSGTGKTTAALTLGKEFGYLSDETAVISVEGDLEPFAKPLSLLVDGRRPKRQVSPDELGLLPAPEGARLAAVALLQRDPEAEGVRVEQVPTVEALSLLAEQTSSLHLLDRPLHTVARMLHERGGARRLVYSEAADLAPVIAELLAGDSGAAEATETAEVAEATGETA